MDDTTDELFKMPANNENIPARRGITFPVDVRTYQVSWFYR